MLALRSIMLLLHLLQVWVDAGTQIYNVVATFVTGVGGCWHSDLFLLLHQSGRSHSSGQLQQVPPQLLEVSLQSPLTYTHLHPHQWYIHLNHGYELMIAHFGGGF